AMDEDEADALPFDPFDAKYFRYCCCHIHLSKLAKAIATIVTIICGLIVLFAGETHKYALIPIPLVIGALSKIGVLFEHRPSLIGLLIVMAISSVCLSLASISLFVLFVVDPDDLTDNTFGSVGFTAQGARAMTTTLVVTVLLLCIFCCWYFWILLNFYRFLRDRGTLLPVILQTRVDTAAVAQNPEFASWRAEKVAETAHLDYPRDPWIVANEQTDPTAPPNYHLVYPKVPEPNEIDSSISSSV
ncbi:hypothetical protein PFISCL1PPCAC_13186, partial [Pristionchus fissidentatus]